MHVHAQPMLTIRFPFPPPWQCGLCRSHLGFLQNVSPGARPSRPLSSQTRSLQGWIHQATSHLFVPPAPPHRGYRPTVLYLSGGWSAQSPEPSLGALGWR